MSLISFFGSFSSLFPLPVLPLQFSRHTFVHSRAENKEVNQAPTGLEIDREIDRKLGNSCVTAAGYPGICMGTVNIQWGRIHSLQLLHLLPPVSATIFLHRRPLTHKAMFEILTRLKNSPHVVTFLSSCSLAILTNIALTVYSWKIYDRGQ